MTAASDLRAVLTAILHRTTGDRVARYLVALDLADIWRFIDAHPDKVRPTPTTGDDACGPSS